MSKEVDEADVFTFNDKFSSKLFKIKIGTVSAQKEGEAEKQETRHKVSDEEAALWPAAGKEMNKETLKVWQPPRAASLK
jgi:hypothetical protein